MSIGGYHTHENLYIKLLVMVTPQDSFYLEEEK